MDFFLPRRPQDSHMGRNRHQNAYRFVKTSPPPKAREIRNSCNCANSLIVNCAILFILAYNSCLQPSPTTFSIPFLSLFGLKASLFSVLFSAKNPLFSAFLGFGLLLMALLRATKKDPGQAYQNKPIQGLSIFCFRIKFFAC